MKKRNMQHCCQLMCNVVNDNDVALDYSFRVREYGIDIRTSEIAQQQILFCPWCGQKLPESLREKCAEELEKLGFGLFDDNIPEKYKTDLWWREKFGE